MYEGTCPPGSQIPQIRNDRRATAFPVTDEQAHPELVVGTEISVHVIDEYEHAHRPARAHLHHLQPCLVDRGLRR